MNEDADRHNHCVAGSGDSPILPTTIEEFVKAGRKRKARALYVRTCVRRRESGNGRKKKKEERETRA